MENAEPNLIYWDGELTEPNLIYWDGELTEPNLGELRTQSHNYTEMENSEPNLIIILRWPELRTQSHLVPNTLNSAEFACFWMVLGLH